MPAGEQSPEPAATTATIYQIRLQGHLGPQWMSWFDGLTLTLEADGNTLLQGPVIDQSALHGILKKVRDLGLPLLLVHAVDFGPPDAGVPSLTAGAA
jgi:hypothetical protein